MTLNIHAVLEEYPETSSYVQKLVKRPSCDQELSSIIHTLIRDQEREERPLYFQLIDELLFLRTFFVKQNLGVS